MQYTPKDYEKKGFHPMLHGKNVSLSWTFNTDDFEKITLGFKPQDMDDRWAIFFLDNCVRFYRSWTMHEIFRIHFRKNYNTYYATSVDIEQDPHQFNCPNDKEAIAMLQGILKSIFSVTPLSS